MSKKWEMKMGWPSNHHSVGLSITIFETQKLMEQQDTVNIFVVRPCPGHVWTDIMLGCWEQQLIHGKLKMMFHIVSLTFRKAMFFPINMNHIYLKWRIWIFPATSASEPLRVSWGIQVRQVNLWVSLRRASGHISVLSERPGGERRLGSS